MSVRAARACVLHLGDDVLGGDGVVEPLREAAPLRVAHVAQHVLTVALQHNISQRIAHRLTLRPHRSRQHVTDGTSGPDHCCVMNGVVPHGAVHTVSVTYDGQTNCLILTERD